MEPQGPGSLLATGSSFSLLHISYLLWELGGLPPGMGYWATGAMGYWATGLRTDWATGGDQLAGGLLAGGRMGYWATGLLGYWATGLLG
jgi:hypothetical protein